MFAKPKTTSAAPAPRARSGAAFDPRATLDQTIALFKKPYVAPASALGAFAVCLVAFLNLAGDPHAGSPSVRIDLDKPKPDAPRTLNTPDSVQPGQQPFSLDSMGLFQDASADGFDSSTGDAGPTGGAVITLPDDPNASAPKLAMAPPSPLVAAPLKDLLQQGPSGPMPVIAPNGMTPASAYARPFKSDGRPMVALVVGGLGLNPATTKQAISDLPAAVTLSFVPYAQGLQGWIDMARAAGHEVMIEVPMQPVNYPDNDPGPQTLLANARNDDLLARLNWVMSRATGYFAMSNYQGGAFFKDRAGMATFLQTLKSRGIDFVDDGQARGITGAWGRVTADRIIDNQINAQAIAAQLTGLEAQAKGRGTALGTGFAYPVTLAVAVKWTQSLDGKGLQLAPASALTRQQ